MSEKAMVTHSSTFAWKIPWMEEPGGLQSMGSLRVGHNWATSLSRFTFMHWRRKWQPTPVFLPGESQGWQSLVGCHLWGRTKSDTTEVTQQQQQHDMCIWILIPLQFYLLWTACLSLKENDSIPFHKYLIRYHWICSMKLLNIYISVFNQLLFTHYFYFFLILFYF